MVDGEVGKDFSIELDAFLLETVDELRIGKTRFSRSVINTGNSKSAKIAFFIATIAVCITKGFDDALFC